MPKFCEIDNGSMISDRYMVPKPQSPPRSLLYQFHQPHATHVVDHEHSSPLYQRPIPNVDWILYRTTNLDVPRYGHETPARGWLQCLVLVYPIYIP